MPGILLTLLKEGNERFVDNVKSNRDLLKQINDSRQRHFPLLLLLAVRINERPLN